MIIVNRDNLLTSLRSLKDMVSTLIDGVGSGEIWGEDLTERLEEMVDEAQKAQMLDPEEDLDDESNKDL